MSISPIRKNRRKQSQVHTYGYLTNKQLKALQTLQEIDKRVYNKNDQLPAKESK